MFLVLIMFSVSVKTNNYYEYIQVILNCALNSYNKQKYAILGIILKVCKRIF